MSQRTTFPPTLTLVNGTVTEHALRDLLADLFSEYALDKWQYTDHIRIEDRTNSFSHPVLTLSARIKQHDELLASYIHEQMHWFLVLQEVFDRANQAIHYFQTAYPGLPSDYPYGGGSEFGTYLHVPVLYLEQSGLREVLGQEHAQQIFVNRPFYTAITTLVLDQFESLGQVMQQYGLILPEKPPSVRSFVDITLTGTQAKRQ